MPPLTDGLTQVNTYVQAFLTNGSFSYMKYTNETDGLDELDYYLDFYTKESIYSLSFTDGALDGVYKLHKTSKELISEFLSQQAKFKNS